MAAAWAERLAMQRVTQAWKPCDSAALFQRTMARCSLARVSRLAAAWACHKVNAAASLVCDKRLSSVLIFSLLHGQKQNASKFAPEYWISNH